MREVRSRFLSPFTRQVKIPGILVDCVVVSKPELWWRNGPMFFSPTSRPSQIHRFPYSKTTEFGGGFWRNIYLDRRNPLMIC